jgi:uncharacterized protein YjiS (DUF1127 family)
MLSHPCSAAVHRARSNFSHLKETPMTVLDVFATATKPIAWRRTTVFVVRTRRFINRLIAAEMARRDRRAALVALRHLSDRELRDFGLYRSQIDFGLDEAAQERSLRQLGIRGLVGTKAGVGE